jgi:hypothetical protein
MKSPWFISCFNTEENSTVSETLYCHEGPMETETIFFHSVVLEKETTSETEFSSVPDDVRQSQH